MIQKSFFIIILIFTFSACKSIKKEDTKRFSTEFENKEYQLLTIEDKDVKEMDLDLRINPDKKSISGESGCNNYRFDYSLKNDTLDLGYGVATKMYCEDTMHIENAFFGAASKVKHFSLTDKMLHFLDEEGKVLITAEERETKKAKN